MLVYQNFQWSLANGILGLGEHKIRDLNDDINRLIKEKGHWEDRIKELGGADYKNFGTKVLDSQGMELPGKNWMRE